MKKESAIRRAVACLGGQSALARSLGLTPQAVSKWCTTGRVPAKHVLRIEGFVARKVTRHELRPDLYPGKGYSE